MSDSIFLEQRGVPSVCVGTEALMGSVGKGMARALGYPEFPGAIIPKSAGSAARYYTAETKIKWANLVTPQIADLLVKK
jgi:hypothetical protein